MIYRSDFNIKNHIMSAVLMEENTRLESRFKAVNRETRIGRSSLYLTDNINEVKPYYVDGTPNLVGNLIAHGHVYKDLNNIHYPYFIFPDLSVRGKGLYYLHFRLFLLKFI